MPNLHRPVLRPRDNDRQLRVEGHRGNVLRVALQYLDAGLVLVVPDAHLPIVGAGNQIGLVPAVVVVHTVDALLVAFQGEVGRGGAQLPHLDGLVEGGGGEGVVVLGVDADLHDVVGVALKDLLADPGLVPVPQLDLHVV